ncbi:MAG: helix-turn-helix transcriptional regulator [Clostridiales bacterium]|nr:helix-turn-helix transcriptional regulator [Clostridiales bacterium]
MIFAENFKKLRKEKQITQQVIADYLGITRQAIAAYEKGKREPNLNMIVKIAEFFEVSVDFLLGVSQLRLANAQIISDNIRMIQGQRTYEELAADILEKTGAEFYPELIRMYVEDKMLPNSETIKEFARYAKVSEAFFYNKNTPETLEEQRRLFIKQNRRKMDFPVMFSPDTMTSAAVDDNSIKN